MAPKFHIAMKIAAQYTKKVVRKDRSPMNPKVKILQLECGHEVYITGRAKKEYHCQKCEGA